MEAHGFDTHHVGTGERSDEPVTHRQVQNSSDINASQTRFEVQNTTWYAASHLLDTPYRKNANHDWDNNMTHTHIMRMHDTALLLAQREFPISLCPCLSNASAAASLNDH